MTEEEVSSKRAAFLARIDRLRAEVADMTANEISSLDVTEEVEHKKVLKGYEVVRFVPEKYKFTLQVVLDPHRLDEDYE